MERKSYFLILIVLISLGIITLILLIKSPLPTNHHKDYVVSGKIIYSEKIEKRPDFVYVYYPFFNHDYLCRSSHIQLTKINWIDNNIGAYEIHFNAPVGLSQVILTPDCTSCDYINLSLSTIPSSVDLELGKRKCPSDLKLTDDKNVILRDTRNFLNRIETNLVNKPYNSTEIFNIRQDIGRSREYISQSEEIANENESKVEALYAQWFSWRVLFRIELYDLKSCLNKINSLFSQYNSTCYIPDYYSYEDYFSANGTYTSARDDYFGLYPPDKKEVEKMLQENLYMRDRERWISEANNKCENSERVIRGTFTFQEPYCKSRDIKFKLSYVIWAIVFIYLGLLIEKFIRWKK